MRRAACWALGIVATVAAVFPFYSSAFLLPHAVPSTPTFLRAVRADCRNKNFNVSMKGLSLATGPAAARRQRAVVRTASGYGPLEGIIYRTVGPLQMAAAEAEGEEGKSDDVKEATDERLYSVRISRVTGIEWGTDLSFSWVYVRDLQPGGAADKCGEISNGDQLCAINDVNTAGAPFDFAMDTMIGLKGPEVEFTFFRGTQAELKDLVGAESPPEEITVTVLQKGKPEVALKAQPGANLRNLLTDNGINVYQSVTRWTNCKGKQLCGTCIVEINKGLENTTVRSLDESSTLRDNPANYRLSCVTDMYDDVTVTVFPPVGAAQWTR